jgi:hypothetical protein
MKTDLFNTGKFSFHYTGWSKDNPDWWEYNVLPYIVIEKWRILAGWLCFSVQYTFNESEDDEL